MARNLRERIRKIVEWTVAMDLRPDNPCGRIGQVFGMRRKVVLRALPLRDGSAAIRIVRASAMEICISNRVTPASSSSTHSGCGDGPDSLKTVPAAELASPTSELLTTT